MKVPWMWRFFCVENSFANKAAELANKLVKLQIKQLNWQIN
ncbi:hypothetical protein [Cytobacillus sp. BC1816]